MATALPVPEIKADTEMATAGYYRLEWQSSHERALENARYRVQESFRADFLSADILYEGPDLATVLSGKTDGTRFYRVQLRDGQQEASQWSTPVRVETRHHPFGRAMLFFSLGALVFLMTLILVLAGARFGNNGRQGVDQ